MPTALITGANRGIGLELARQYRDADWDVIATARDPSRADALRETGATLMPLDAADPASIAALATELGDTPVDLLIANAGIWGGPATDAATWTQVLATNTIGPALLAEALKPAVLRSRGRTMIAVTSGMGSIGDNSSGGFIPYRASKAALNMTWTSLAIAWRAEGLKLAVINPGWVKTDMGGANAAITPEQSVKGMRRQIEGLTLERSGSFLSWDGRQFPW